MSPRKRNTPRKSAAPRSASPHVKATDFGSIGYGVGYAFAQDNICVMADTFVTVRGERSRYFGGSGTDALGVNNLANDFFYALLQRRCGGPDRGAGQDEARSAGRVQGLGGGLQPVPEGHGRRQSSGALQGRRLGARRRRGRHDAPDALARDPQASSAGNGSFIGAFAITNPPADGGGDRQVRRGTRTASRAGISWREYRGEPPHARQQRRRASAPMRPTTAAACSWATRTSLGSGTCASTSSTSPCPARST